MTSADRRRRHRAFLADLEARGLTAVEDWLCSVGPAVGVPQADINKFSRVVREIEKLVDSFFRDLGVAEFGPRKRNGRLTANRRSRPPSTSRTTGGRS